MNCDPAEKWVLKLYVAGKGEKTEKTSLLLKRICHDYLGGQCEIEIIDIKENPQIAVRDNIMATPCLSKIEPEPAKRIIGELTDRKKLLKGLDIDEDGLIDMQA
jgi:circadian clock protein KaiB